MRRCVRTHARVPRCESHAQVFWIALRALHVLLIPVLKEEICFAVAAGHFQKKDLAKMEASQNGDNPQSGRGRAGISIRSCRSSLEAPVVTRLPMQWKHPGCPSYPRPELLTALTPAVRTWAMRSHMRQAL